jgi:hypothetical protein
VLKEHKVPIQVLKELLDRRVRQDFLDLKGLPKELKVQQDRQVTQVLRELKAQHRVPKVR